MKVRDRATDMGKELVTELEAWLHARHVLKPRCDWSDLPVLTCAHCLGHELDPDIEAAIDY